MHAETPPPQVATGLELKGQSVLLSPSGELAGRWDKSHVATADKPAHTPVPPGHLIASTSTYYGPDGEARAQWVTAKPEREKAWREIWAAVRASAEEYQGVIAPTPAPECDVESSLTLYPLGDPHIGLLSWAPETGENFDLKIATTEIVECVRQLVASTPRTKRAVLLNLGDMSHAQDDDQVTPTAHHKLDVDGRRNKVMQGIFTVLRSMVDLLLAHHEHVTFVSLPGNHDPLVAYVLAAIVEAWCAREPRVTVAPAFSPFWFEHFGRVLLGATHGDRIRFDNLAGVMATDRAEDWGASAFRYWHTGHVHHQSVVELPGVTVETHNTLAAKDAHSHKHGYRARRELKSIIYHREYGETQRHTVGIDRVRRALEEAA